VQQFPKCWEEAETAEEIKEKYPTLIKITRMYGRNDTTLNSIRADFHSLKQVQTLLQEGTITVGQMKLPVKTYHQPARIRKCMRCYSHEHATISCSSQQICIRCGQQHPLSNDCRNEIKCVNCQQRHYAGHPSCPVVQQKRKQLAEQQKIHRAKLLVKDSNLQTGISQSHNTRAAMANESPRCSAYSYAEATKQRTPLSHTEPKGKHQGREHEHIEQILMATAAHIETRVSALGTALTAQLCELEAKIDNFCGKLNAVAQVVYDIVIPAIQTIIENKIASSRIEKVKQQATNIGEAMTRAIRIREQSLKGTTLSPTTYPFRTTPRAENDP
jgi:hypothetical protein